MALTSSFGQRKHSRKRARSSLEIDPSAPVAAKAKKSRGEGGSSARRSAGAAGSPRPGGGRKTGSAKSAKSPNGRRTVASTAGRRGGTGAGKREDPSSAGRTRDGVTVLDGGGGVAISVSAVGTAAASLLGGANHARLDPMSAQGQGLPARRKPCNCKNSRCLKLYCECFAAGVYCEGQVGA
jgi:hypothetical protein